jgi:hypothetical protein
MTKTALPDVVFTLAGVRDPFLAGRESPYLLALMGLNPKERRSVARQAAILAAVLDVDTLEALELLGQIGILLVEVER